MEPPFLSSMDDELITVLYLQFMFFLLIIARCRIDAHDIYGRNWPFFLVLRVWVFLVHQFCFCFIPNYLGSPSLPASHYTLQVPVQE